jgi:hypothetical protein
MLKQPFLSIPLDIPDVRVLQTDLTQANEFILTVESTLDNTTCRRGGRTTGSGGGLQIGGGGGTITNTTFSGNQANGSADDGGGALMVYGGKLTLSNVTIAGNSTTSDGSTGHGAAGISAASDATITLKNTIVAGNNSSAGKPDLSGTVVSGGHNLIGDTTGSSGITNSINGDQVGTSAALLDPKLGSLADNGGATQTVRCSAAAPRSMRAIMPAVRQPISAITTVLRRVISAPMRLGRFSCPTSNPRSTSQPT